jgi:hypothetical protein
MVTGTDAFRSSNAGATMLQILKGRFDPPSTHFPECPPELEVIIHRALALNPDDRFESTAKLRVALLEFIQHQGASVGPEEVSRLLTHYLGEALTQRRARIRAAQEEHDSQGATRRTPSSEEPSASASRPQLHTSTPSAVAVDVPEMRKLRAAPRSIWLLGGALALSVLAGIGVWSFTDSSTDDSHAARATAVLDQPTASPSPQGIEENLPVPVTVTVEVRPADALISVEGGPARSAPLELTALPDQKPRSLQITAKGYEPRQVEVAFDRARTLMIELTRRVRRRVRTTRRRPRRVVKRRAASATPATRQQPAARDPFSIQLTRPARRSIDATDPFQD